MSDATVNTTAAAAAEASDSVAAGAPLISLDHVTVEFGRGKKRFRAVDDVSLTINKGSIYGIIGFSGAGKSTLVRTMNVLQRPTSGTVTFNGTTISTLGEGRLLPLRRKIAMIFQHFNLMPSRTVLDNVTLPLIHEKVSRKDARAKAMHLLELVGIADKAKDRLVFAQRRMHVKTLRLEPVDELISLFLGNVVLQNHNHVGDLQSTIKNAAQSILCRIQITSSSAHHKLTLLSGDSKVIIGRENRSEHEKTLLMKICDNHSTLDAACQPGGREKWGIRALPPPQATGCPTRPTAYASRLWG